MKIVSQLDDNGYFICTTEADESPLEPGIFLIPAGCIDREPPEHPEAGKHYKPDKTGWQAEDIPATPSPVTEALPQLSEQEQRLLEVNAALQAIDQQSIRPARIIAAAMAAATDIPSEELEKLNQLEKSAQDLREERQQLLQAAQESARQ